MENTATPSAHTPGPWSIETDEQRFLKIAAVNSDGKKCYPAKIDGCVHELSDGTVHCDRPEVQANARLIAAAPDLLAACRAACGLIYRDKNDVEQIEFSDYEEAERRCLDAIAKSKGE